MKLDKFTQAYIECALWSSSDDDGEPLDGVYTADDLSEKALQTMVDNCADFQRAQAGLLEGLDEAKCGHDFWLTRNGHGAGFWDRGLGEVGEKLTEACRPYGSQDLCVGDDGNIHVL